MVIATPAADSLSTVLPACNAYAHPISCSMQPADLFNPVVAYGAYDASMGADKRVPFHGIPGVNGTLKF